MLRGVVFDMDQTLYDRDITDRKAMVDFYQDHRSLFRDDCSLQRAQEVMVKADHAGGHFGWSTIIQTMAKEDIFTTVPDYQFVCDEFQHLFGKCCTCYHSTIPVLQELHELGLSVAMITNGKQQTQMGKIEQLGLKPYFDKIIIGWDKATAKPHPDLFLQMATELGCKPEELCYVGDHPVNDIQGSRDAGYTPIWIRTMPWDFPEVKKPALQIDTLDDLIPIVKSLLLG